MSTWPTLSGGSLTYSTTSGSFTVTPTSPLTAFSADGLTQAVQLVASYADGAPPAMVAGLSQGHIAPFSITSSAITVQSLYSGGMDSQLVGLLNMLLKALGHADATY